MNAKELLEKEFAGITLELSDENDMKLIVHFNHFPEIDFEDLGEFIHEKMSETMEDLIENGPSQFHVENASDTFDDFLLTQTFWASNFGDISFDEHNRKAVAYYYFDE